LNPLKKPNPIPQPILTINTPQTTPPTRNESPTTKTQTNPTKKSYTDPYPLCNTCQFQHPATTQYRLCDNCDRYDHMVNTFRELMLNQPQLLNYPTVRTCYNCGDPSHLRNTCPNLVYANQVQTYTYPSDPNQTYQTQISLDQINQAHLVQPILAQPIQAFQAQVDPIIQAPQPLHVIQEQPMQEIRN